MLCVLHRITLQQMKELEEQQHQVKSRRRLQKPTERRRKGNNNNNINKRRSQSKLQETGPHNSQLVSLSSATCNKSLVFPRRPGYGQLGTKCLVKANHFLADISVSDLTHYNVSLMSLIYIYYEPKIIAMFIII